MQKMLNGIFQGTATANPATLFFAGFPIAPTRAGGGTESQYTNYSRPSQAANQTNYPAPTGTSIVSIKNAFAILFPSPPAPTSETWNAIAQMDAATGGNMWAYYALANLPVYPPIQVGVGELVGEIVLNANGGLTTFAATNILECLYQKKSVAPGLTDLYLAGFTSNPTIAGGGTESSAGVRVDIPCIPANWAAASGTNPVVTSNNHVLTFPTLPVVETWVGWALLDQPTPGTGNMWAFGLLPTPLPVNNNQPSFAVGSIQPICTGTA